ncbi:hypothetical protein [Tenacibaculum sp. 190524A05c]|uniref:hypothetical protein n=1 Tax=Tenacibaculum platacis TaxID=3137852 RepID=UPI0032B18DEE
MLKKYTQIDWGKALLMLIPPLLRKPKQAAWIKTLAKPLSSLYDDTLYKMQHNGQVMYLEKVLNDLFNPCVKYAYSDSIKTKMDLGYIVIEDAYRPRVQYLYTHDEIYIKGNDPIVVANNGESLDGQTSNRNFLYLSGASDFSSTEFYNFRILIPSHLLISYEKYQDVLLCLQNELQNENITQRQQVEQVQELNDFLVISDKPLTNHPDSIKIVTPKFHKVVNFYKLAGKSYETRKYDVSIDKVPLETIRSNKERSPQLKNYMYIK